MDPLVVALLALALSMTPCIWFWALWWLVWGWGRPPLTCGTKSVGLAARCVYGFQRIVSALRGRHDRPVA